MATINRQPRAFGYLRVSTDQQADSGLGLEAQRAAVEAAAGRLGLVLADVFTDEGVSGALDLNDRPALLLAVQALKRGDALVIAKRDRLGRDVLNVALIEREITRKGARVISAAGEGTDSTDPGAMLQRGVIDLFSEFERKMIGARTRAALRAKRQRGELAGNLPFGYSLNADGRTLDANPVEQAVLSILVELRAAGYSLRQIAAELNRQNLKTRRGTAWRFEYVRSLLSNSTARPAA